MTRTEEMLREAMRGVPHFMAKLGRRPLRAWPIDGIESHLSTYGIEYLPSREEVADAVMNMPSGTCGMLGKITGTQWRWSWGTGGGLQLHTVLPDGSSLRAELCSICGQLVIDLGQEQDKHRISVLLICCATLGAAVIHMRPTKGLTAHNVYAMQNLGYGWAGDKLWYGTAERDLAELQRQLQEWQAS